MTPMLDRTARRAAPALALTLGAALLALGGAPAPAAAATLIRSCPTTISAPGTYVLAGDLTCAAFPAIAIRADAVRLDLGGHTLTATNRTPGFDGRFEDGIVAEGTEADPVTGLRVGNGTVAGFNTGVRLAFAPGARLAGVTATGNGGTGIEVRNSSGARVVGNTGSGNGGVGGISVDGCEGCELSGNRADRNSNDGIYASDGTPRARFTGNTATGNGSHGIHVDDCDGCVVSGNTATGNGEEGLLVQDDTDGARVAGNTATGNGEDGIAVAAGSTGNRLEGNRATGNGTAGFGDTDLEDGNLDFGDPPGCFNTWRGNRFVTDNEGDGPGAGCIR